VAIPIIREMNAFFRSLKKSAMTHAIRTEPNGVWIGRKKSSVFPCTIQFNKRYNLLISGIREPITTRLISCFIVFPVIQPMREWVSQSGILVPPFESTGLDAISPCPEKEVYDKGNC